jgi:dephospho-CoA kinase
MLVYGLTGGIATGKSTVSGMIVGEGVPVFDADQVAREIVLPGKPAWRQIVAMFGEGVIGHDQSLDRAALAKIVFADPDARRRLEAITHPRIRDEIGQRILEVAAQGQSLVFVDAALMIETGWAKDFAGVVVVDCPPDVQRARLVSRDRMPLEDAERRIAAQMPLAEKRAAATYVIENGGDLEATRAQVKALVATLKILADATT